MPFSRSKFPILSDIPLIGPALFSQTPLTYLAFTLVGVVWVVLYRTPLGLALRAAGENPCRRRRAGSVGHRYPHGRGDRRQRV